jgi:ribosomal protein S7
MAQHKAMLWLIEAANEKNKLVRFYDALAKELIAASQNQVYNLHIFCNKNI